MSVVSFYLGKHTTSSPASPELNMTYNDAQLNDDDFFDGNAIEFNIPDSINTIVNAGGPVMMKAVDFDARNGKK